MMWGVEDSAPVSDQLSFLGTLYEGVPWLGRSPRGLTRVRFMLIFEARAGKSVSDFVDPAQYDLFGRTHGAPPEYGGAPLLLPLPKRFDHGTEI